MILIFLVIALILAGVFYRLPSWLSIAVLLGFITFSVWLSSFGLTRSSMPLLLAAMALGLLIPVTQGNKQHDKIAPSRTKKAKAKPSMKVKGEALPSLNSMDVPGYDVMEKVGSGGMASVYKARRQSDGHIVALKIPMEQYVADAKFIRRFHREAEVAQRLDHENIVRTFEHGSVGIKHYMAMEYVDGRSLEGYVESGELTITLGVEVMKAVVKALQHIHSEGIIHRDIKPANIMIINGSIISKEPPVLRSDAVKLMDFGIAGGKVLSRLTMTGARVGTPVYMSPEQARGVKIDHRSDIYSLGLVFYEMLTGQTAFKGGYEAIVHQQIFQTPPPPRQLNLAIPKQLDSLIMQMIAKDPNDRPRLADVLLMLEDKWAEEMATNTLPSRLVITVSSRQGVLRILDTEGSLHSSMGNIGLGEDAFSAAPLSIAVDSEGNYFAAVFEYRVGQENTKMIHKLNASGKPISSFGAYGMGSGEFLYPIALAVGPNDWVYVLDSETNFVQCFDAEGAFLFHFGGRGHGKGGFNDPRMVKTDRHGHVYVLDYGNRQVQRFSAEGNYQTRWAFKVSASQPEMRVIDGLSTDSLANLYISDATGGKVRKISAEGKVELSYAIEPLQGEATDTLLDLGVDDKGYLYAARRGGHLIRKYDLSGRLVDTLETYAPVVQMIVDTTQSNSQFTLSGFASD